MRGMRPDQHRQTEAGRLQYVMAADGLQAAADEHQVAAGHETGQFAVGIDQEHARIGVRQRVPRTSSQGQSGVLHRLRHRFETFDVAWRP